MKDKELNKIKLFIIYNQLIHMDDLYVKTTLNDQFIWDFLEAAPYFILSMIQDIENERTENT